MDLILNINGLPESDKWKNTKYNKHKTNNHKPKDENSINESDVTTTGNNNNLKEVLINLQNDVSDTQDKINLLQIASNTLNNISVNLNELRELALETIDHLDDYELPEKIKHKLENIDRLGKLQEHFEPILDYNDQSYCNIVQEFKHVSDIIIKLAKIQGFEKDLNNNSQIERVLNEINNTLMSVSNTKSNLDKVKSNLIINIKSLNVTLENMVSSYSKIRSIKLASKTVQLAQHQILNEALKSISTQTKEHKTSTSQLIN